MFKSPSGVLRSIWLYVVLLSILVIILWSFFWPKEFKLPEVKSDGKSMGEILTSFTDSVSQGGEVFSQITKTINNQADPQVPAELINELSGKINDQFWQQRTAGWREWSNENFSFKLPANWYIFEGEGKYILNNYDPALSIKPADRTAIELSFIASADLPKEEQLQISVIMEADDQEWFNQFFEDFKKTIVIY